MPSHGDGANRLSLDFVSRSSPCSESLASEHMAGQIKSSLWWQQDAGRLMGHWERVTQMLTRWGALTRKHAGANIRTRQNFHTHSQSKHNWPGRVHTRVDTQQKQHNYIETWNLNISGATVRAYMGIRYLCPFPNRKPGDINTEDAITWLSR